MGAGEREDQQDQPGGRDDLADRWPPDDSMLGGEVRADDEHHVGQQCAADRHPAHWATVYSDSIPTGPGPYPFGGPEHQSADRDDRVEVRARHRPEHEDQDGQPEDGGGGVLQQLQTDVVGRQLLGRDPGTDDDRHEQPGAEELGKNRRRRRAAASGAGGAAKLLVTALS